VTTFLGRKVKSTYKGITHIKKAVKDLKKIMVEKTVEERPELTIEKLSIKYFNLEAWK
jgi:hypothetical protein